MAHGIVLPLALPGRNSRTGILIWLERNVDFKHARSSSVSSHTRTPRAPPTGPGPTYVRVRPTPAHSWLPEPAGAPTMESTAVLEPAPTAASPNPVLAATPLKDKL